MPVTESIDVAATMSVEEGTAGSRAWHAALYLLLVFVFVTGGSSQQRGWSDAIAQLMALPVIFLAAWRLGALPSSRIRSIGVVAFASVAVLPWLQLLPLPGTLWALAPARASLGNDLATAGVVGHATTWSLTPAATVRAGLSLLPGAALFLAVLGADDATQRRLLILCVLLPIASLVLGFLQLGAPQDSLLNPFPEWAPAMGGVFANPNHQGTAMLIGLGICLAFAIDALRIGGRVPGVKRNPWPAIIAGGILLPGLTLTNSRAAVLIGVLLLAAAPVAMSVTGLRRSGLGLRTAITVAIAASLVAIGSWLVVGWMRVDQLQEVRGIMRHATALLALQHLPWGSGIGSFVPVFQQSLPDALLLPDYINAAHNDYVQVWLEAGIPGLLVAAIAASGLVLAAWAQLQGKQGDRRLVWAAVFGLGALLVHAAVDYPLRTPALLAVAALLAGILVAQGARNR
jgi:O-antigen ligase